MRRFLVGVLLISLAVVFAWSGAGESHAGVTDLPPRPTAVPTATPVATSVPAAQSQRAGATILLHTDAMPADIWTVVQWQDAHGNWHDVEGWQGRLDDGVKRWWVAPADFRKGPFRWAIYERRGSGLLGTSEAFNLPQSPHEIVTISYPDNLSPP